jgi:hypothetical protein
MSTRELVDQLGGQYQEAREHLQRALDTRAA